MCDGEERHFKADEHVGDGDGNVFYVGVGSYVGDEVEWRDEEGDSDALPEAEEEYSFDTEKFRHGPEGLDVIIYHHPEYSKRVEGDAYGDIVDYGDIKVPCIPPEVAVSVGVGCF